MPVAAAIAGSAVLGAGASIYGANKASSAAKSSNNLQGQIYASNKATLDPYAQGGTAAVEQLRRILGLGDSNTGVSVNGAPAYSAQEQQQGALGAFMNNGSYQFGLNQGLKNVQAVLGSKGYLDSGAAQKSLLSYGQNYAGTALNNYVGQLQGLANTGLSAGSALAGVGTNYANAVSANNTNAANAQANGVLSAAGQVQSAINNGLYASSVQSALGSSYGGGFGGGANKGSPYVLSYGAFSGA